MSWVIVKDLPQQLDEKELRAHLSFVGKVDNTLLIRDKEGMSRRFAFVGFTYEVDAKLACGKLNRTTLLSSRVRVEIARPATLSECGKLVSVSDATHIVKPAELNDSVQSIQQSNEGIFLRTASNTFSLEMEDERTKKVLSLGEILKRKGTCQKLVGNSSSSTPTSMLKAQVVVTNLLNISAAAGTSAAESFLKELKSEDSKETSHVLQVLSEEDVNDSQSLSRVISSYLNSGQNSELSSDRKALNLGLVRLPSANLAAATVARCLVEIRRGNFEFVVPFIDVLGVVAVSNSALRGYLAMFANKFKISQSGLVSIVGILNHRKTIHGMEAAIVSIPDLPEFEIVRAAQCVVRIRKQCIALRSKLGGKRTSSEAPTGLNGKGRNSWLENEHHILKVHRLLLRCVVTPVDRRCLMKALNSISMDDVKHLLQYFGTILSTQRTRSALYDAAEHKRDGTTLETNPECYYGTENWMDKEVNSRQVENEELQGCVTWTSALLDAHKSSLLFDSESHQLLAYLLKHVSAQRKRSECVISVLGALEHVQSRIPVPRERLQYERYKIEVNAAF